jgi:RNA polymerase sigma factor (sigma-70 family)
VSSSDAQLLCRYLDGNDADALGELVRRHVDLVYSAALRQVGRDTHFAEDVVQRVFTDFLRKATTLRSRAVLSGWFYTSTHYTAAKLVRSERRRKTREMAAYAMKEINSDPVPEIDWNDFRPLLDHAMHELNDRDREMVLLRYFERLPLVEVGRRLGLSENATSKAVERSLGRLRACFAKRGITSTSTALALALTGNAIVAAPAGLASALAASLLATGAATGGAAASLTFMAKNTTIAALACLVLLSSGIALYKSTKVRALERQVAELRMDNLPVISSLATPNESHRPLVDVKPKHVPSDRLAEKEELAPKIIKHPANAGRTTPNAAYETFYWAMESGDLKAFAEDVIYDDEAKAIFGTIFSGLSPEAQAFFGTPEVMAAGVGSMMNKVPITRLEILGAKTGGPDAVMLSYLRNGETKVRTIPLVHADDGWKVVGRGSLFQDPSIQSKIRNTAENLVRKSK